MERKATTHAHRWFRLWILAGAGLAILLLASTVINFVISSRTTALFNTRRQIAREMAALDKLMRAQKPDAASLSRVLDQAVQESNGNLAWAQILDREGAVIARSDAAEAPAFTVDYVASRIRERRPVFAVRDTSAGPVVVEAFSIRLPLSSSAEPFKVVALKGRASEARTGAMAFVELASLATAGAVAWPARWTLILGVTTGLALLGALTLLVVRFRAHISARRVERQIEIARQVQRALLPSATASPRDFELAAEWRPAASVSGDFYDAFDLPQQGAAFVFGDVSGKDVPAAMLASVIQGTVHATSWTRSAADHNTATEQLNRLLCERASQERFASLFWGYFDVRTGLLHYVNCGHCAPLLFRTRRQGAAASPSVLRLSDGGPVLGLLPHARFEQGAERLEAGDVLVLYSDGVVEATNTRGEEYGEHRLVAAVESAGDAEPDEIRDRILRSVREFTGSDVLDDDQTLLAIRYTGAAVAALQSQAA